MKISDRFVLREIAGDSLLIPLGQTHIQGMLLLNPVSMLIYQELQKGKDPEEILGRILAEYDIEKIQAKEHLRDTLAQMRELGILET